VHTPWVPKESDLTRRRRENDESAGNFKAVLAEYDKQVGRLLAGLKELDIENNTLLIFSSDNGPLPTFEGKRAGGLRGSKISLYEGGTRMPLIVRWPGHVAPGVVDEKSVLSGVDFLPMFCAIAGAARPGDVQLDGEELSQAFLGNGATRKKPLFWEYGRNSAFGYPKGRDRSPNVAVRDGKWKLLLNADGSGAELYDLEADRNEARNVAEQNPEVTKRLTGIALEWRKALP
jgi:arylsulfatase A-like enzyme